MDVRPWRRRPRGVSRRGGRGYYGIVRVRIVVLNWNGHGWLEGCLSALEPNLASDVEVVLVDNASVDGSIDLVHRRFSWVRVVELDANVGFARGSNLGAAG